MSHSHPLLGKIAAVLLLAVIAGGAFTLWQKFNKPDLPPGFITGNGRLEATEVDVSTKLAGRITDVTPREGDAVNRDQVVARLDADELNALLRAANAQTAQARSTRAEAAAGLSRYESDLLLARNNLERTRQLIAKGFISPALLDRDEAAYRSAQSALDTAHSRIHEAEAAIEAASAQAERVRTQLKDAGLTAPISGRVLYRLVEPGEVLGAGGKVLTLLDLSDVYMTVYLPSDKAGQLPVGAEARIVLDARPEEAIPAKVSFVADRAQFTPKDVETRSEREKLMFRVKVKVDADWLAAHQTLAKPGMPGIAFLRLDDTKAWPATLPKR
ncbi:HlyD family efflux transporter periplasmic adaptor subunit [Denitratisoma sp. agr-D3]